MNNKTNRVLICLPNYYHIELTNKSNELGLSRSDIIRRALDNYFKELRNEVQNNGSKN